MIEIVMKKNDSNVKYFLYLKNKIRNRIKKIHIAMIYNEYKTNPNKILTKINDIMETVVSNINGIIYLVKNKANEYSIIYYNENESFKICDFLIENDLNLILNF